METNLSLGAWLKHRRSLLDLTQRALGVQAACSAETLRKLERDRIRPSHALAQRLATALHIPAVARDAFLEFARGRVHTLPAALRNLPVPTQSFEYAAPSLPVPTTPLVGRAADVAAVRGLLSRDTVRLVTLVGPPGVGKTRLALQVATELAQAGAHDVCLVDLAPLRNARLVLPTLARALGVQEPQTGELLTALQQALRTYPRLVVLDNAEHVCAAAPLLAELLTSVPQLNILVTSRIALRLSGEHLFAVLPLALPPPEPAVAPATLAQYAAVVLFVQRAQAVQHTFVLDATNAHTVARICTCLDGIPLALELAAARLNVLPPQALLRHLDQRLDLLRAGTVDAVPHHQTLWDAIAWSYDLLAPAAQMLFRRLSVFAGGWTLAAAAHVCVDPGEAHIAGGDQARESVLMLERMALLVEHHLVTRARDEDDEPRFMMLETLRAFALAQCGAQGEGASLRARHAVYFLQLAAAPHLSGQDQQHWLRRLDADLDNLRAAFAWSQTAATEHTLVVRSVLALTVFWETRGYLSEGWAWLHWVLGQPIALAPELHSLVRARAAEFALARGEHATARRLAEACLVADESCADTLSQAIALGTLGTLALSQNAYDVAYMQFTNSLRIARVLNDTRLAALLLYRLGMLAQMQIKFDQALTCVDEALVISRQANDAYGIVRALTFLAHGAFYEGDPQQATVLFGESLRLARQITDQPGVATALNGLGEVARLQGAWEQAIAWYGESKLIWQRLGKPISLAAVLQNLGHAALQHGDLSLAVRSFAESMAVWRQFDDTLGVVLCVVGYAGLALARQQPRQAVRLLGAAAAILAHLEVQLYLPDRVAYDQYLAAARSQLDKNAFDAAWHVGQAWSFDQTLAEAMTESDEPEAAPPPHRKPRYPAGLTAREVEVLQLVTQGLTNAEVAARLIISPRTVNTHLGGVYRKLNVASRSAATRFAVEHGLS